MPAGAISIHTAEKMANDGSAPHAPRPPVGSVSRAIALLDVLAGADGADGLGVNELARRIGVNASTASRLLATLEQGGLVDVPPAVHTASGCGW